MVVAFSEKVAYTDNNRGFCQRWSSQAIIPLNDQPNNAWYLQPL
jgi:hypothetical protein